MDDKSKLLNYDKWHRRLMNIYWICNIIILITELIIGYAYFAGYLLINPHFTRLPDYLLNYIVIPSGLTLLLTLICELLVIVLGKRYAKIQPYVVIFTLVIICVVLIIVHNSINVIYVTCTMPILFSLVYNERKVLLFTLLFSFVSFLGTYLYISMAEPFYNSFSFTELLTSSAILLITYLICSTIFDRFNDIVNILTEREHSTYEARLARDYAEATAEARARFLVNVSHEIRTPMNGIIGLAELALEKNNKNTKKDDYLVKIKNSAIGLMGIVNDILDMSKIDAGKINLEETHFLLGDVLTDCESLVIRDTKAKGLRLYFFNEVYTPVVGDPARLRQALLNILYNAVKFTIKGSVTLLAKKMPSEDGFVSVYFEISDTGIGILEERLEEIFKPFTQADDSTTRNFGGTGLGLAISQNIIEMMGGTIEVASIPGAGSRFSFTLTFAVSREAEPRYHCEEEEKTMLSGDILVCEDNELSQEVVRENLELMGLRVVMAGNGLEGVNIVRERMDRPFDLIFMDFQMPVMDGLQAAKELMAMGVKTPIIAMTANAITHNRQVYTDAGMAGFLYKPFRIRELRACLQQYLTSRVSVDTALGLEYCFDNRDLYQKSLAMFAAGQPEIYDSLEQAVRSRDYPRAQQIAHTAKNNARLIGATGLADILTILEESLRHDGSYYHDDMLRDYKQELTRVLEQLTADIP